MFVRRSIVTLLALSLSLPLLAQPTSPAWVKRSNENAQIPIDVIVRFSPEGASQFGVEGHDTEVTQITPDTNARTIAAFQEAITSLQARLATEKDPAVRQDLNILIDSANDNIKGIRLNEKYQLPYFNLAGLLFQSMRGLLDERVAAERRPAALVRLRKYAGLAPGTTPLTDQAMAYTRARFANKSLIGPFKDQRDASDFADALEDENISAFSWVSPPGQPIRKIVTR